MPGGSSAPSDPHRFDGDGHLQTHALLCVVSLATRPHGLAGGEAGCLREDHGSVRVICGQSTGGSASATIPAGSCPTVTLHAAAVEVISIEAIIEVEAVEVEDLTRHVCDLGEQGVFHGSVRLVCKKSKGSGSVLRGDLCHLLCCHTVKGLGEGEHAADRLREHQQDGGDQGEANQVCHGWVRFDAVSLQGQQRLSGRDSDGSPTDPCCRCDRSSGAACHGGGSGDPIRCPSATAQWRHG